MNNCFDIPICLFMFRRSESTVKIIKRISQVKPKKIYLLADAGRNAQEKAEAEECRRAVLDAIDWDCEIVKNFAQENRGVYANIGLGAKWVFEREEIAIFLEDDNLPEITFFDYCRELLEKYKDNDNVLWICGTNYLAKYQNSQNHSYMFTKHLLPCGWASWSHKFIKYYDGELKNATPENLKQLRNKYDSYKLYDQQKYCVRKEQHRIETGKRFASWDYQMAFSIRFYDKYGISPCNNQIKNIGVDGISEHGGNNINNIMTNRFCGMDSHPLDFPLCHPDRVEVDPVYEKKIHDIILNPFYMRMRRKIKSFVLRCLGLNDTISYSEITSALKSRKNKKHR